jgi:ParB family chromosome partitioning protein
MRHDAHYVDELASQHPTSIGRFIALDLLDPNPEQPRVEIGDLTELTTSIVERGVLEPLLVKPNRLSGRWMIIAGERRWRAARAAGLREVPCIEMDVDESSVAEIALIENMQRKDLTAWEEADGLAALCQRFGYTHEEVSKKVGKSRSTVTEALSLAGLPKEIREECIGAEINTKSLLLQIVRQPDLPSMRQMVEAIAYRGMTREEARASRRVGQASGGEVEKVQNEQQAAPFIFKFNLPDERFKVEVRFQRAIVEQSEIVHALRVAIAFLESETDAG